MTKTNYTDITLILDRSGSMASIMKGTLEGINGFIAEQKTAPGEATLSLIQFDDQYEVNYLRKNMALVQPLGNKDYTPRGTTALLDAIGKTINTLGETYSKMAEVDRPSRVIVVIQTDGFENASKEFSKAKINEMITTQRNDWKWDFIFLGANQDAFNTAADLGIASCNTMTYSADHHGSHDTYASASGIIRDARMTNQAVGGFSQDDYNKQVR